MICKFCTENLEEFLKVKEKYCFKKDDCYLKDFKIANEYENKWILKNIPSGFRKILVIEQFYYSTYERFRKTIDGGVVLYEHFFKVEDEFGTIEEYFKEISEKEYNEYKKNHSDKIFIHKNRYVYDKESLLIVDEFEHSNLIICEKEYSSLNEKLLEKICLLDEKALLSNKSNYLIAKEKRNG